MNEKFLFLFFVSVCCVSEMKCFLFSSGIKQELFDIYKGVALQGREITNNPFTPEKVRFFLFTRENSKKPVQINPQKPEELANSKVQIAFVIHGWLENRDVQWYIDLKDALLALEDEYYVVNVDWSELANDIYTISSYTTKDVGGLIGELIARLSAEYSVPIKNVLVIGHSLGGQTAGFVGKKVNELAGEKLPRIVALDPAGPAFINRPEEERLNKNDATIVHVIHTDGGKLGFLDPCGSIDFFPNGGSDQPGCYKINLLDPASVTEPIMCDHQRSWGFFVEAVADTDHYIAKKCSDWKQFESDLCDAVEVAMGDLKSTETGKFYLQTSSDKPYWKFEKKLGVTDAWNLATSRLERMFDF